jgi:opine dehydrogenase
LDALFGKRFRLQPDALTITLNNHNPVYHVAPMLCNLSRAEKKENWVIWENITPGVARLVKLVDDERLAVAACFGTRGVPVEEYFREAHGAEGNDLNEIVASVARKLNGPVGPQELDHRFITEDVPYALVLYCALGRLAGIPMPVSESLIQLTSALYETDFFEEGHNLEALGLDGMTPEQILAVTRTGF